MKKLVLAFPLILLLLAFGTQIMALEAWRGKWQMMPETASPHEREGFSAFSAGLNLTSEQQSRIKALRETHLRELKPFQDQIFRKRGDLKLLWLQSSPDREKILAVQREIRGLREQMQEKAMAQRGDILSIMTPEQQEQVKLFLSRHGHGVEVWSGPGMIGH